MASSMAQFYLKSLQNAQKKLCPFLNVIRNSSALPKPKAKRGTIKHRNLIASSCESLAARGFLRSLKPYTPEENVTQKLESICKNVLGADYQKNCPLNREDKFTLLSTCFEKLNYSVPNSLLHKMITVQDIITFYQTPVSTSNPYDKLLTKELPPNLYILPDYVRFDPETDIMFKGVSAFPRSSTIVSSHRYKEKYKGTKAKSPYLDTEVVFDKDKWN